MTEWPNVPVLKTGVGKPTGGSNPSFTASKSTDFISAFYFLKNVFLKIYRTKSFFMIYKNWTLKTFFLLIISSNILFIACLSDQSNEYANFEKHAIPKTKYTINPHKDTTLFGPQGTRIFIGAETFQIPINTLHKDSIGIVLKEFYRHSDILLANLETASDGEILETAGMLHIKALAGNELLEMKPNKRIVVHFPKKSQKKEL